MAIWPRFDTFEPFLPAQFRNVLRSVIRVEANAAVDPGGFSIVTSAARATGRYMRSARDETRLHAHNSGRSGVNVILLRLAGICTGS